MKRFSLTAAALTLLLALSSCEQKIKVESVVHPDGSIDRSIVLSEADSDKIDRNIFGASRVRGWETSIVPLENKGDSVKDKKKKNTLSFHKHFPSVAAANAEMNSDTDTLFRIRSGFERKFRWFYTYINYSDTYIALNHFRMVKQEGYFTPEDYAFIERLPAEGKSISKADSLYLSTLNTKIFDQFATRALFEEYFQVLVQVVQKNKLDRQWIDKLNRQKEAIYSQLVKKGGDSLDDNFMVTWLIDSLHVPLANLVALKDNHELSSGLEKRINFVSDANEGKYTHIVKMPWAVVATNADSVNDTELFWHPPVTKFLLTDYTMYAESRRLNYWTLILSGVVMVATAFVFFKRRTTKASGKGGIDPNF